MQINTRNTHTSQATSPAVDNTLSPAQQRQAVKKIAGSLQGIADAYERVGIFTTNVGKLNRLRESLIEKDAKLAALRANNLDRTPPTPTIGRKLKSATALSGGVTMRTGAVVAAGVFSVGQAGVIIAGTPVLGAASGALSGLSSGFNAPVACAKPLTAVVGLGLGAVSGAVGGIATGIVAAPVSIGLKGSIPRRIFSLIDQMPKARQYAQSKKSSTRDIADKADKVLTKLLSKVIDKQDDAEFFAGAPKMAREMATTMHTEIESAMEDFQAAHANPGAQRTQS